MDDWKDQTFGEFHGNYYRVGEAFSLLPANVEPVAFPLADLERNFSEASCEEPLGSDAFWARANACDMRYPLLVVQAEYPWVVDGVHRLFRARAEGWTHIKAFVIPVEELKHLSPVEILRMTYL